MSARDFLLNDLGPAMKKYGGWFLLAALLIGGGIILYRNVQHSDIPQKTIDEHNDQYR